MWAPIVEQLPSALKEELLLVERLANQPDMRPVSRAKRRPKRKDGLLPATADAIYYTGLHIERHKRGPNQAPCIAEPPPPPPTTPVLDNTSGEPPPQPKPEPKPQSEKMKQLRDAAKDARRSTKSLDAAGFKEEAEASRQAEAHVKARIEALRTEEGGTEPTAA
jgi:hypothetical protein